MGCLSRPPAGDDAADCPAAQHGDLLLNWLDKYAAQQGQWRTPENTLHLFSLLGGRPGAWFAQQLLRHKSSKPSFRAVYRVTVVLRCLALTAWLFRSSVQRLLLRK